MKSDNICSLIFFGGLFALSAAMFIDVAMKGQKITCTVTSHGYFYDSDIDKYCGYYKLCGCGDCVWEWTFYCDEEFQQEDALRELAKHFPINGTESCRYTWVYDRTTRFGITTESTLMTMFFIFAAFCGALFVMIITDTIKSSRRVGVV